jgi:hypothetical protein
MDIEMRRAEFPDHIGSFSGVVSGYYGGPAAFYTWQSQDWTKFTANLKLPIWMPFQDPETDAERAIKTLQQVGFPRRGLTALDCPDWMSNQWYSTFSKKMFENNYQVITLISPEIKLNSLYNWISDCTGRPHMYDKKGVVATEYARDIAPGYSMSLIREALQPVLWR